NFQIMVTTRLTMIDAHEYICTVKDTFQDNREMYDTFLMVMKDFRTTRYTLFHIITTLMISDSLAIAKVKDLFKGHCELILGFNNFMPEDYKITFESDEHEKPPVKFVEAINFVKNVKATLQNDRAFGSFLEIMQMFRQNKKSADEVYHEVIYMCVMAFSETNLSYVWNLLTFSLVVKWGGSAI
ncbi:unnamed protein product, partial [Thlaspi arvense]